MIHFDVTRTAAVRHRSGLARLSERLRDELGTGAVAAAWPEVRGQAGPADWFVTTELFSEPERPGFSAWLHGHPCRTAAVFADAIPLKFPHTTWPHSVARHPGYMKLLAAFDQVWAISAASRDELLGYWRWLELETTPPVRVLPLGSDLSRTPRAAVAGGPADRDPALLCVGILEPRKNQLFLLDVCEELWRAGQRFELHLAGRVNPHFGRPIVDRIRELRRSWPGLHHHATLGDTGLEELFRRVRATVCPTIAEGCGLPLLESLWHGVPCVGSDLPVLRENADGGGCVLVPTGDRAAWREALGRMLADDAEWGRLRGEAVARPLPTWREAAAVLRAGLG